MKTLKIMAVLIAIVLTSADAMAQKFRSAYQIPTAVDPVVLYVADINGDGLQDIVYGDYGGYVGVSLSVHVLLAQATGGYLAGPSFDLPANTSRFCRMMDANGDGKADLVCVLNSDTVTSVQTFLSNGDGSFAAPKPSPLTASNNVYQAYGVSGPFDVNSDGRADIVVTSLLSAYHSVMLGDGAGGFKFASQVIASGTPESFDVNGDGKPDLLFSNRPVVLLGHGDGKFSTQQSYGSNLSNCVFHDMDGDGHVDAVCGQYYPPVSTLMILHGNADGSFELTPSVSIPYPGTNTATFLNPIAVADVNGDGIEDVLAYAEDGLTVILGKEGLNFAYPTHSASWGFQDSFAAFYDSHTVQVLDMNQDGLPDVVAVGPGGIYVSYGLQDGTLDAAPAMEVATDATDATLADFNGDGIPDIVATDGQTFAMSLGKGDGSFQPPVSLARADASPYTEYGNVLHGDFNGDGKQDLLADFSNQDRGYFYSLYPGTGKGTFADPSVVSDSSVLPNLFNQPVVLDINGDGFDDIVTGAAGTISSALSDGHGYFTLVTSITPIGSGSGAYDGGSTPALADFNHDGKVDAVVAGGSRAYFMKGLGDGRFAAASATLILPSYKGHPNTGAVSVASGDFDGDGNADVAMLVGLQAPYLVNAVYVYFGNGDGTFAAAVPIAAFNHSYGEIYSASLSGGSRADLMMTSIDNYGGNSVGTIESLAGRAFGPEIRYHPGRDVNKLMIADINRDGLPDLLLANLWHGRANSITKLMNIGGKTQVHGTLISGTDPTLVGAPFTLVAQLTPPVPADLAGVVQFYAGSVALGSASVSGNFATLKVTRTLSIGVHPITAKWAGNVTYPAVSVSGSHTILGYPASVSLVASVSAAIVGTPVTLTATVSADGGAPTGMVGFYSGASLLGTAALNGSGVAALVTSKLPVGTDAIKAVYAGDVKFASAASSPVAVAVKKLTQTISFSVPASPVVYGAGTIPLTVTASSGLPVTLSVSGPAVLSGHSLTIIGAGSATVVAAQAGNQTYAAAASVARTVVVNRAVMTVTVHDATVIYGAAQPRFRYALSGFVRGDTQARAVTGVPALTTSATMQSPVNSYVIMAATGTLVAKNYSFRFVPGKLVITKAALTVVAANASALYNEPLPRLTYSVTGFANGDTTAVLRGVPVESTTAVLGSLPGSYLIQIAPGSLNAHNYSFTGRNGTLKITSNGIAKAPVLSPAGGSYTAAQVMTISGATAGSVFYYTVDGTTPSASSTRYVKPVSIAATTTVKAIAIAPGYLPSAVTTVMYTLP